MRIAAALAAASLLLGGCATMPPRFVPNAVEGRVTVRVAFDTNGITSSSAEGAGIDQPVRIASISKLVVALGVMRLVEARTLDLDLDVSRWLGWQLRHPGFPNRKITLRLLLSHSAGLTDAVDYAIPLGSTMRATLADAKAWDADHAPGGYFRYANLNFPVIASVMEAATGERFDRLMTRLVFTPLDIDACFNWTTCSDEAVARAVVLRDASGAILRDDLRGIRPPCPVLPDARGGCDLSTYRPGDNGALFSPQGGLRISARGLARIGQMLLRDGDGFVTRASIAALTAPAWTYTGTNGVTGENADNGFICAYGLGFQLLATPRVGCRDDPFGDARGRDGHAGDAYGLKSGLWIDRARGTGVAYFVTAVADDAPTGRSAFTVIEEQLASGEPQRRHRRR